MNRLPLFGIIILVVSVVSAYSLIRPYYFGQWGTPGSGPGQFNEPMDIAYGSFRVFVTDTLNNRVQKFYTDGDYAGVIDGSFNQPEGIDVNSFLWIADTGNNCVKKYSLTGSFIASVGSFGSGQGQFNHPSDILEYNGYIYIVDQGNSRIQKFNRDSLTYVTEWGSPGNGPGQFNNPSQITVYYDTTGYYLYVTDTGNNRIQRFTLTGDFVSSFGSFGSGPEQFNHPIGIRGWSMQILIADTLNNRIQAYLYTGQYIGFYGSLGSQPGQFNQPIAIATFSGNSSPSFGYVLDKNNNRVQYWRITDLLVEPTSLGNLKALYH
jgi:tripartite motif-containing protein 71